MFFKQMMGEAAPSHGECGKLRLDPTGSVKTKSFTERNASSFSAHSIS
jgi:hypothetical protein